MRIHLHKRTALFVLFLLLTLVLSGCSCSHKNTILANVFEPTCTTAGYSGDLQCADCDAVLETGTVIEMIPHQQVNYVNRIAATCTEDGFSGDAYCVACDTMVLPGETIPATGHEAMTDRLYVQYPSCTGEGYTGDILCTRCNTVLEQGEAIPALGHTPGEPQKARAATCTKEGRTGEIRCLTCNSLLQENETIPVAAHTPGEPVGAKAATCKAEGRTGEVRCTTCDAIVQENLRTKALGHECVNTNCEEEKTCTRCGEIVPGFSHAYSVATQTEPATCAECGHTWGQPLTVPFYTNGDVVAAAQHICAAEVLDKYFSEKEYLLRTDPEAVDYYMSTERVATLYDDGKDVLLTSKTGFYFGTVADDATTRLYALLQTDLGIENSEYGYFSVSVYKSANCYWIVGSGSLIYIDTVNEKLYEMKTNKAGYYPSMDDRYAMYNQGDSLFILDRETCQAQLIPFSGVDSAPYFDQNGVAILIVNSAYTDEQKDYAEDFRMHNTHYYYTWNNACLQKIAYADYPYVVYADSEAIMVEKEFSFEKIVNGEAVWSIKKKDLNQDSSRKFAFQTGVLWQYGNNSSYYFTYLVPQEQPLLTYSLGAPETEKVDLSYFVPWSSRFSDCHNYDYTDHSIDHMCVFDHMNQKILLLNKYHRSNRTYNQTHVLWDRNLPEEGGRYGVYAIEAGSFYQRNLTK